MRKPKSSNTASAKKRTINTSSPLTLEQARKFTQQQPQQAAGWKLLGQHLLEQNPIDAINAIQQAITLSPDDVEALNFLAHAECKLGKTEQAINTLTKALKLDKDSVHAHFLMARIFYIRDEQEKALNHIEQAVNLAPNNHLMVSMMANVLHKLHRYDDALNVYEALIKQQPEQFAHWNNAGNVNRDLGKFKKAEIYYKKAIDLSKKDSTVFSNHITSLHYQSEQNHESIFLASKEWESRFGPNKKPARPVIKNKIPNKKIRIGLFSSGFSLHPVGQMITAALENLSKNELELYLYSTNDKVDFLTKRLQATTNNWTSIHDVSDFDFSEKIRNDNIDILIDLCGHNSGTRMQTVVMEPAPLIVKWVGGLINTTGVEAIDYLLSDNIETPAGDDNFYTEKLIRLPDDYICYTPPYYVPEVTALPAEKNNYITLGCLNNPCKTNEVVLSEWAKIMHALPNSCLLLKGYQYSSPDLCSSIHKIMEEHGIAKERVTIEGPSSHRDLLETYNKIDIALDPWPYSGGLTTCEAMLMGVPVVTMPGPTFAGRHSATHLVNAGMPELVVDSWDAYRDCVIGLASDLNSLATIRSHLRNILLQSPVCDGPRFAKHFTTAMRAIWQRYCEDKAPAALSINQDSEAWFKGESQPMNIQRPAIEPDEKDFDFSFTGKIIVLDNGASLVASQQFSALHKLGAFSTVVFDPSSKISNTSYLQHQGELHHFPHSVLGAGEPATLYTCMDPAFSGTLEPLADQLSAYVQPAQLIAKLPISTQRLDSIEGLSSIDWLILDNLSDSLKALESGKKSLANTLLIQARISLHATHKQQPELGTINNWLIQHGFSFYRLNDLHQYSHLPKHSEVIKNQATQLISADALFIPNEARLAALTDNQRLKLAFILHAAYGIQDLTYEVLRGCQIANADDYLKANGYIPEVVPEAVANLLPPIPDTPHMSGPEAELFEKHLLKANRYFEFGSGGSTKLAARHGKTVFGVESDQGWIERLKAETGFLCKVDYVDIGPTKEWGYPVDMTRHDGFKSYSGAIQNHNEPFDLVLVDGRFRVACVINTITHALRTNEDTQSTYIFIHDFWNRPQYHAVLDVLKEVERADTAGVFRVRKGVSQKVLDKILGDYFLDPR